VSGTVTGCTRFKLGQLTVDEPARRVRHADDDVPIEPKVFDLLLYFAHRPARVISQDELLEAVWGRSIASDAVVSQAIFKLRRVLRQQAGLPDALVTLRGVGFRLDAEIIPVESDSPPEPRRWLDWRMAVPALVLLIGLLVWWQAWRQSEPMSPRVALLNVDNATGDSDLDWFEAGGSALMSEQLVRRGIEVVSSRQLERVRSAAADDIGLADAAGLIGIEQVLVPRLTADARGYRMELVGLDDNAPSRFELSGSGPVELSLALAGQLADQLGAPIGPPAGQVGLGDPFLDEAYARAYHHRQTGDYEEAVRLYDYILSEAPEAYWASYHLSVNARMSGDMDRSRELLEALLDEPLADVRLAAAVRTTLGNLEWYGGNFDRAETLYRDALGRFSAHDMRGGLASVLGNLGMLAVSRGRFSEGRNYYGQALAIFQQDGNRVQEARVFHNMGYSYFDEGDYDQAIELVRQAYAIRSEAGLRDQAANTRSVIAEIAIEHGRFREGQALLEQSLTDFERSGNERGRGLMLADLADVALRRGLYSPARDYGLEALALATARDEPMAMASAAMTIGRSMHATGDFMGADEYYERAGELWKRVDNKRGELSSLAERARLALDRGRPEQALALIDAMTAGVESVDSDRYRMIYRSLRAQWQIDRGEADTITADIEAILGDAGHSGHSDALRATLVAEIAERLHGVDPDHDLMQRMLPLMTDWAPRYFPAARLLYLTAVSPDDCRTAIRALEQLRGTDWSRDLPRSARCPEG
jgi:DNA-binding winged helix-turn-helix (wHTH) protein/tetratricopeptide (TPR) repeat protein